MREKERTYMKKKVRITCNAPVVLGFVGICALALLLSTLTSGASNTLLFMTYRSPFGSPLTYLRLFTHVFGHAGIEHFVGNMTYILLLGPMLEEKYSSKTMLEVIAVTAVVTGTAHYLMSSSTALCGASGVVFAFIILSSFTNFKEGEIPLTFILIAVIFIGQQVVQGVSQRDNISNMSHIIGGITGGLIGYRLNKK